MLAKCLTRLSIITGKQGPLAALLLLSLGALAGTASADTVSTLSFSGAHWNDGGTLSGYFTVLYDQSGTPLDVLAADIASGSGTSDGFTAFEYVIGVNSKSDTVASASIDATQPEFAANELYLLTQSGRRLFLDWTGSSPGSLYLGNFGGEFTSEDFPGSPGMRFLNSSGGSLTPEPSSLLLLGAGLLAFGVFGPSRNKKA